MTTSPDTTTAPATASSPYSGTVPAVASVPKSAEFQFGYDGHDFFLLKIGAVVAVAR